MDVYQWEDDLGPLPPPVISVESDGKDLWLKQHRPGGDWFPIAKREDRQWVSLYSNLRIDQPTPRDPITLVRV